MGSSSEAIPLEDRSTTSILRMHRGQDDRTVDHEGQEPPTKYHRRQHQCHEYLITRQSSLLSLTLDEIQSTVCEPGKSFGSMNMDEFLTNIWTAEETNNHPPSGLPTSAGCDVERVASDGDGPCRQGPLSLPGPLCRKTVDEVWTEMHREHPPRPQQQHASSLDQHYADSGNAVSRQPTLGEMTLEDFLIKAGVVREADGYGPCPTITASPSLPQQQYAGCLPCPSTGCRMGYAESHRNPVAATNASCQLQQANLPPRSAVDGGGYYDGNGKVGDVFVCCGLGSPTVSPVSSDGFGGGVQMDNPAGLWGGDIAMTRTGGRKRVPEGPVEKVVERRQRRMIKNRESAARSRARKQAYTVELEAELNHLKEENARLREEQKRLADRRRQMIVESMSEQARINQGRRFKKTLRRCNTCLW